MKPREAVCFPLAALEAAVLPHMLTGGWPFHRWCEVHGTRA